MKHTHIILATALLVAGGAADTSARLQQQQPPTGRGREATATITRRNFVRAVRLSGTVEAVQATTVAAPPEQHEPPAPLVQLV